MEEIYEKAVGPCVACGKDSTGSFYWTPLPKPMWNKMRRHVARMFKMKKDFVQNMFFIPPYSQPFCSAECSLKWHEEYGSYAQEGT